MSLEIAQLLAVLASFPRSRGDEPFMDSTTTCNPVFSPLTRG